LKSVTVGGMMPLNIAMLPPACADRPSPGV